MSLDDLWPVLDGVSEKVLEGQSSDGLPVNTWLGDGVQKGTFASSEGGSTGCILPPCDTQPDEVAVSDAPVPLASAVTIADALSDSPVETSGPSSVWWAVSKG